MGKWFGTDGVRGVANEHPMTAEMALAIGRAVALEFRGEATHPRIVIGKDTRLSGDIFEHALVAGICSAGGEAVRLGVIPTPGVAHMARALNASAGIVISASHNPFEDNGIKLFSGEGRKLPDAVESEIEAVLEAGFEGRMPTSRDIGSATATDGLASYGDLLRATVPEGVSLKGLRIALDCSNGATSAIGPEVFRSLGADVTTIHDAPDGVNINAACGSQHPEDLQRVVRETGARIGLAFDGDGDRVIAVDEAGAVVTGDQMLAVCALELAAAGDLAKNTAVSTVMSNIGLGLVLKERGIEHVTTAVGDRYVREAMDETGAIIGGEDSGHMIFGRHHTTGDGILSGLQLVACVVKRDRPLSELAGVMTVYPQHLENITVTRKPPLEELPEVTDEIASVEAELGDQGRVLVRYSGTQSMCRVMVEGPTPDVTERATERIAAKVRAAIGA